MSTEKAYLAGGCFWGMEELIRNLKGVLSTEVGYCGGDLENPIYETVKVGTSGHAESIEIEYDPNSVSFEALLHFFFRIHDPTTSDRQGNDVGSQYRSAIFYTNDQQKQTAETVKASALVQNFWKKPIKTEVVPFKKFFRAEEYHQDYLQKNPQGYTCHFYRD
jgi:peptide-methionine (S)-S-oxide reductase